MKQIIIAFTLTIFSTLLVAEVPTNKHFTISAKGFDFNGEGFIDAGDLAVLKNTQSFTVAAWIYPTTLSVPSSSTIISKTDTFVQLGGVFWTILPDGALFFILMDVNGDRLTVQTAPGTIVENAWQHVALVFDGAALTTNEKIKMYLDGGQQTLSEVGTVVPLTTTPSLNVSVKVGAARDSGGNLNQFTGQIPEVVLSENALNRSKIRLLRDIRKPIF